ncbi:MAG: aspartate dehydrogenase [Ruminococcus sp.]|nr:aspartate dehydrogenase [Ruminococcus sp.]
MKLFSGKEKRIKRQGGFEVTPMNPETHDAVIRSSICTGEKVAGFKRKKDGHFTEVMLIRTPADLEEFKTLYHVTSVTTEY